MDVIIYSGSCNLHNLHYYFFFMKSSKYTFINTVIKIFSYETSKNIFIHFNPFCSDVILTSFNYTQAVDYFFNFSTAFLLLLLLLLLFCCCCFLFFLFFCFFILIILDVDQIIFVAIDNGLLIAFKSTALIYQNCYFHIG